MPTHPSILIVDFGSQLTLLIERALREEGHRAVVLSPIKAGKWFKKYKPKSVIYSGSHKGVRDKDAPKPPANIARSNVPKLGICYGMQLIAKKIGGTVARDHANVEYGPATITLTDGGSLFAHTDRVQNVWASHGDSVLRLPRRIKVLATDKNGENIRAIHDPKRKTYGVQFHPEVKQTDFGPQILLNFVRNICGCEPDWQPLNIIEETRAVLAEDPTMRVVMGFSGGVDSTVSAAIASQVLGDRLLGVCINAGQLRAGELDEIRRHAKAANIKLVVVRAQGRFLKALKGVTDAEKKRKIFRREYARILKEWAAKFKATHVLQGTLAPDLIESAATGGDLIKTHHNVGINWRPYKQLHPLAPFFKYEVRALAKALGLPKSVINREPFPGPGLFIRILGEVTKERLDIVRWADHHVRTMLANSRGVPRIDQLVVALCCVRTTGVTGDKRAYHPAILVRGVQTSDFMTVRGVELPPRIRRLIKTEITRHKEIVRVWFDEMDKPPGTTEFE